MKRKMLTGAEQDAIIRGYEKGIKNKVLATTLNLSPHAISMFWSWYKQIRELPPVVKVSKRKINASIGLEINKILLNPTQISVTAIPGTLAANLPDENWLPSRSTVYNFMKDNNMVKKAAHIKPPLSDVNKIKRLKFARKWLVNGVDTLENVMWSDETKIQAYPSSRKTFY